MHVFSPQGLFASRVLNLESQEDTQKKLGCFFSVEKHDSL